MHKICAGRKPLSKETISVWQENNPDIRADITGYFCDEMMIVRDNIDAILSSMGLPREYIAKASGMDKTLLSVWFSQKRRSLSPQVAVGFCDVLHCTCSELIMGEKLEVKPPKRLELFYRIIKEHKAIFNKAEKILASLPRREDVDVDELIYERMMELITDDMCAPFDFINPCKPGYVTILSKMFEDKKSSARLPTIFGICLLLNVSPDYLMKLDYTSSPIMIDNAKVEASFMPIISKFLTVSSENQDIVLGQMLEATLHYN